MLLNFLGVVGREAEQLRGWQPVRDMNQRRPRIRPNAELELTWGHLVGRMPQRGTRIEVAALVEQFGVVVQQSLS